MLEVGETYPNGHGKFITIIEELPPMTQQIGKQIIRVFKGDNSRSYFESGRTVLDAPYEIKGKADLILIKPKITLEL